jgi:hypothetical protein
MNSIKKSQDFVEEAIENLTENVRSILEDNSLSLTEKDKKIFPFLQRKRVLKQTKEDLDYLDERDNCEIDNGSSTCKMSQYR